MLYISNQRAGTCIVKKREDLLRANVVGKVVIERAKLLAAVIAHPVASRTLADRELNTPVRNLFFFLNGLIRMHETNKHEKGCTKDQFHSISNMFDPILLREGTRVLDHDRSRFWR